MSYSSVPVNTQYENGLIVRHYDFLKRPEMLMVVDLVKLYDNEWKWRSVTGSFLSPVALPGKYD